MSDVANLTIKQCERFFRRHGLPLLVDGHSLSRDVYGRSAPFLLALMLLETVGVLDTQWSWWQNTLASIAGLVGIAGCYILLNLVRRRPWSTLPQDVGRPELAFFVLVPGLLAWALGGGWPAALAGVILNVLVLLAVRVLVGLGLLSTLGWGVMRVATELGQSLRRLVRLLPLILIFSIVLFFTTEVWQVFDTISGRSDVTLGAFFVLIIVVLAATGSRREADAALAGARTVEDHPHGAAASFSTGERRNVVAMVATTQLLQILVVSMATFVFFVVVGMLAITPEVRELWTITGVKWKYGVEGFGYDLVIDQTLVRVAGALATFSGLYYAINVQVDAVYRTEFVEDVSGQLHQVVEVREHYLALLADERENETPPVPLPRRWRLRRG